VYGNFFRGGYDIYLLVNSGDEAYWKSYRLKKRDLDGYRSTNQ